MGNDVGEAACERCKQNCVRIHGKNMTSPPIMSFFKIMIGDNFSKFVYLPPKFGRTVPNLVGKKVNLEDTNGYQWVVTVTKVDNSIAFKQGWPAFSSDHGLNFGDFVIFHYLSETSFVVHVYDNSGCEKSNFPNKGYPNKRPRTGENCISKDVPKCHTSDKSSMNKQDSTTSAPTDIEMNQNHCHTSNPYDIQMNPNRFETSNLLNIVDTATENPSNRVPSRAKSMPVSRPDSIEESFIMINRDLGIKQEEARTISMFDLSNFEMHSNVSVFNRSSVSSYPKKCDLIMESQTHACTIGQDPVAVEMHTREKEDSPDIVIKGCQLAEPSGNISNEALFGDNQVDAFNIYQTLCRSVSLNNLQEPTKVSESPSFSAPRLQNYREETRNNQVIASKINPTSSGASPDIIPKGTELSKNPRFSVSSTPRDYCEDEMMNNFKQEKIGIPQEFVALTPEHSNHEEMIQDLSGTKSTFMEGSQSQNEPIDTEIPSFSVSNRPQNYRKEPRGNQVSASKMYPTSHNEASPNIITEGIEVPEIPCFSVSSRPQCYREGKEPKIMKGSQSQSFSPTLNGTMKVVKNEPMNMAKNEPINTEIPRFSLSSRPQNYCEDKMTMGIKQEKIGVTQEFIDLTPEHGSREEMIQGISGNESKSMNGSQSQSFSPTINEVVKVVITEPTDTEISRSSISSRLKNRRDKMMMDFKRKIGFTKEFVDSTPEHYSREEMIQGISGKKSKFMEVSQTQSFIPTIDEDVKVVKNEPIDTDDPTPSMRTLSCLVSTDNQSFLELPSSLPPFKGKMKYGNTVCLQDSVMRRWAVIYHEKYNLQVFTTGWEAFSRANNIQQGDECIFELENWEDAKFRVRIMRRF